MASIKPVEDATQDFSADLAALRDDVAKLTSSVSDFIHSHTAATTSTVVDAVDNARQKYPTQRARRRIASSEQART
jgi:hypothetical protein